ncbi:NUDIX domain-containing protein [Mesorhizobium sp. M0767]|uniref:NUDIX domain-containing protein n=1 Tax=unclassified Mesorhizobium TaxID=325217 RepID=UPI00333A8954
MTDRSPSQAPTHAGGVVYRVHKGKVEFLLITARRQAGEWVLPKGHVEGAEQPDQTAVREVFEEAGVHATVVRRLTDLELTVGGKPQRIVFFLMSAAEEGRRREGRHFGWFGLEEALSRVTFAESRDLIARAALLTETLA